MLQPFTEGKAVVQLALPLSWVARINRLAVERGLNRSALIREAIAATYFATQPVAETTTDGGAQEHEPLDTVESEQAR